MINTSINKEMTPLDEDPAVIIFVKDVTADDTTTKESHNSNEQTDNAELTNTQTTTQIGTIDTITNSLTNNESSEIEENPTTQQLLAQLRIKINANTSDIYHLPSKIRISALQILEEVEKRIMTAPPHAQTQQMKTISHKHTQTSKENKETTAENTLETGRALLTTPQNQPQQQYTTYAEKLKRKPKAKTILLYPKGEKKNIDELLFDQLNPTKIGIRITGVRRLQNNGYAIDCPEEEDLTKLVQKIREDKILQEAIEERRAKTNHPKIILYGIMKAMDEEEVMEAIRVATDDQGTPTLAFKLKGRGDKENWVVSLPPGPFKRILHEGRINIGWDIVRIREFFSIIRCFRCQQYGHTQAQCTAKRQFCAHCSGHHNTRDCKSEYLECINCCESNDKYNTKHHTSHSAAHNMCPSYQRLITRQKRRTTYE